MWITNNLGYDVELSGVHLYRASQQEVTEAQATALLANATYVLLKTNGQLVQTDSQPDANAQYYIRPLDGVITLNGFPSNPNGSPEVSPLEAFDIGKEEGESDLEDNHEVSITENGEIEITPITGKDGMKKVTATVNVSGGGGGGVPQGNVFSSYEEPVCIINVDTLPKLLKQQGYDPDTGDPTFGLWMDLDKINGHPIYYATQKIVLAGDSYDLSWLPFNVTYEDGNSETQDDLVVPIKIGNNIFVWEGFRDYEMKNSFNPLVPYQESQNGLRVEYYTDDGHDNPVPHLLQAGETTIPADAFDYISIFADENNPNGFVQDDANPISGSQYPISQDVTVNIYSGDTVSFNVILIDYENKTICAQRYVVTRASE